MRNNISKSLHNRVGIAKMEAPAGVKGLQTSDWGAGAGIGVDVSVGTGILLGTDPRLRELQKLLREDTVVKQTQTTQVRAYG